MKLVTISTVLLQKLSGDPEMMRKSARPCVLILRLYYKGKKRDFAVPLRSNISASTPKDQYFALPPRPSTQPHNHHGIHYIKMFPIKKQYLVIFRTSGNAFATLIKGIIDKNTKQIIAEAQNYLTAYENGIRPPFSTDIDYLITEIDKP